LGGVSGTENVQVFRQPINNNGTIAANVDIDLLPDGSLVFGQRSELGVEHFVSAPAKTVLAGNWYHVAAVRDATNASLRLYINGAEIAAKSSAFGTNSWNIVNSGGPGATQGALNNDANTNRIRAAFDDVRIYRTVRTPSEILQDMGAPLSKAEATEVSSLVFYAPLEGTSLGETDANSFFKGTLNGSGTGTITSQSVLTTPFVSWLPNPITNLTVPATLSTNVLTATARSASTGPILPGNWTYSPAAGVSLSVGTNVIVGTFVPTDLENYAVATATNRVVVSKGTPQLSGISATSIQQGSSLSSSTVNGTAKNSAGADLVGGWTFVDPSLQPSAGSSTQQVRFTPSDSANYETVTGTVSVTVIPPNSAPVASGSAMLAAVPKGVQSYVLQGERVGNLFLKNFSDANDAGWARSEERRVGKECRL